MEENKVRLCVSKKTLRDGTVKEYTYARECSGRKPGRPKVEGAAKVEKPYSKAVAHKLIKQLTKEELEEVIKSIRDKISARVEPPHNNADPVPLEAPQID